MSKYKGNCAFSQGRDSKLIGDTGPTQARYVKDKNGRDRFVTRESCDNASGKKRRLCQRRTAWSNPKIAANCNFRLKDIERFIVGEFGGPCETDDAEHLFDVALPLLVAGHIAYGRSEDSIDTMAWAKKLTPKLAAEAGPEWFRLAEERVLTDFDNHNGEPSIGWIDDISHALGVTKEKRLAYGLKHLPAVDRPPEIRRREAKEKDAAYQKEKRAQRGATDRNASITARQPWLQYGLGRRQWERKVAAGIIPADPAQRPVQAVETDDGLVLRLIKGGAS